MCALRASRRLEKCLHFGAGESGHSDVLAWEWAAYSKIRDGYPGLRRCDSFVTAMKQGTPISIQFFTDDLRHRLRGAWRVVEGVDPQTTNNKLAAYQVLFALPYDHNVRKPVWLLGELLDLLLPDVDQPQADQLNSLAEGLPVPTQHEYATFPAIGLSLAIPRHKSIPILLTRHEYATITTVGPSPPQTQPAQCTPSDCLSRSNAGSIIPESGVPAIVLSHQLQQLLPHKFLLLPALTPATAANAWTGPAAAAAAAALPAICFCATAAAPIVVAVAARHTPVLATTNLSYSWSPSSSFTHGPPTIPRHPCPIPIPIPTLTVAAVAAVVTAAAAAAAVSAASRTGRATPPPSLPAPSPSQPERRPALLLVVVVRGGGGGDARGPGSVSIVAGVVGGWKAAAGVGAANAVVASLAGRCWWRCCGVGACDFGSVLGAAVVAGCGDGCDVGCPWVGGEDDASICCNSPACASRTLRGTAAWRRAPCRTTRSRVTVTPAVKEPKSSQLISENGAGGGATIGGHASCEGGGCRGTCIFARCAALAVAPARVCVTMNEHAIVHRRMGASAETLC
eukprot:1160339-Pelagomonas_calceolata.AAC.6